MDSRERVRRALEFRTPDRAPRDVWLMFGVEWDRQDEIERLRQAYPMDVKRAVWDRPRMPYERGTRGDFGVAVDEWGCAWVVGQRGVGGEIHRAPLEDWSAFDNWRPPYDILKTDLGCVNRQAAEEDVFLLSGPLNDPFQRMQHLRRTQNLFLDLGYGDARAWKLRDMVHEFFMTQLQAWVKTDIDAVYFSDDWGTQQDLLISPQLWREFYKPLYKDYCDLAKQHGKYVFVHSDGQIISLYEDLIELGVNSLNSQLFCMDMTKLRRRFKGRIAFWGEIDRQQVLPFGTPDDVRAAVRKVRSTLGDPCGGVFAQCEWGIDVPYENVAALYEAWAEPA